MFTKKLKIKFPHISKFFLFCACFLALRIWYYYRQIPQVSDGVRIRIVGQILSEPSVYDDYQIIRLQNYSILVGRYEDFSYGDQIVVEGLVEGQKLRSAKIVKVQKSKNPIFTVRNKLVNFYKKSLPSPDSALVSGMVVGSKEGLPSQFWEKLKSTSTAHVVVASGTNITMVAMFTLNVLLAFFKRKTVIPLVILSIIFYVFISGFDAPIVRAAIMGTLSFVAQELGKTTSAMRILFLSAFLMLLFKPVWIEDLGFILSFVSTLCLILFEGKVSAKLKRVPNILREGLSTSIAAQIGVAPIIFVTFGQFNILSPVINALVLWTTPYIMIIGMIGGVVGLMFEPVGKLIILLAYPFTYWFTLVINLFS